MLSNRWANVISMSSILEVTSEFMESKCGAMGEDGGGEEPLFGLGFSNRCMRSG